MLGDLFQHTVRVHAAPHQFHHMVVVVVVVATIRRLVDRLAFQMRGNVEEVCPVERFHSHHVVKVDDARTQLTSAADGCRETVWPANGKIAGWYRHFVRVVVERHLRRIAAPCPLRRMKVCQPMSNQCGGTTFPGERVSFHQLFRSLSHWHTILLVRHPVATRWSEWHDEDRARTFYLVNHDKLVLLRRIGSMIAAAW